MAGPSSCCSDWSRAAGSAVLPAAFRRHVQPNNPTAPVPSRMNVEGSGVMLIVPSA